MRWKRWLLGTLLVLVVLGVGLLIAAKLYLRSSAVAARVAAHLRKKLGVPVRVKEADIGLFGDSTIRHVEMFESDSHSDPWATVGELSTDISAADLLSGAANPRRLTLKGLRANLHFDKDGRLLTKMPRLEEQAPNEPGPTIALEGAEITLHQQGAKDQPARTITITGADLHIEEAPSGQTLSGTVHDPHWGDWQVEGRLGPGKGRASLTLRTSQAQVTQQKLESIPFVAASVWKQIKAEGPTAAEVTLHIRGEKEGMGYYVDLRPDRSAVEVPSIGLRATDTTGRIIVDGPLGTLRDMRGRAAGGQVEANGTLDFRKDVSELKFTAQARNVDLLAFTRKWKMPKQIRDM